MGRLLIAVRDHLSDADRTELNDRIVRVDRLRREANLEQYNLHQFLQKRWDILNNTKVLKKGGGENAKSFQKGRTSGPHDSRTGRQGSEE
jgi:hypothetical protein